MEAFPEYRSLLEVYRDREYVDAVVQLNKRIYSTWSMAQNRSDVGLKQNWSQCDFDDDDWQYVNLFDSDWKCPQRGEAMTGVYWLRKRIHLAKEQIVSDATLYLGCIIDADEVFVNGQKVGSTAYQYPPRIYKVPATLLKEGENVVVIRLMVDGAAPGFYADKPYKLATSQGDISLLNDWRLKRSCTMPKRPAETFIQWQPTG